MSDKKDFWKSVEAISSQQRELPDDLRRLAGVPKQSFRADLLPVTPKALPTDESDG